MGTAALTGFISGVSGRVNTVEDQIVFINQDLLQRPDLVAFEEFQSIWNTQITVVNTALSRVTAQLQALQTLYVNLNITVSNNLASFTGHTGTTTGQGVHFHT